MLTKKQKSIILIVLFFVITYSVLYGIGVALTPDNIELIKTYRTVELSHVFAEDDNSLDVLVIGHSGVLYGFTPMEMYDAYGITSFNLAKTTQAPFEAYHTLLEVLKHQTPKAIVINVDEFTYDKADNLIKITALDMLNKVFPIFNVHTRWKYLTPPEEVNTRCVNKNYVFTSTAKPYTKGETMFPTDKEHKIIKPWKKYLDKICDLCEEKGIGILFIEFPTKTFWNYPRHNGFQRYADARGITFFDYNLLESEIGLDWTKDTCDKGDHMNCYGAKKCTLHTAKYLQETYGFTSHKGQEAYANWDAELQAYRNNYGIIEI